MISPDDLRVSPLLSGAAPETLRQLAAHAAPRVLARGETLWRAGDPVGGAFILLGGEVRLTRAQASGRSLTRVVRTPGEVLGLRDVLGAPATFCEDALGGAPSRLVALPGTTLRASMRDPAVSGAALALLAAQTRDAEARLDLLSAPVAARLVTYLLERGPHVLPTNSALAEQLGTVPELVSRHLGDLYRQGLIGLRRREVVTLDEPQLRRHLPG